MQILQTQLRLQFDQCLHGLSFHLYLLGAFLNCETKLFHFRTIIVNI